MSIYDFVVLGMREKVKTVMENCSRVTYIAGHEQGLESEADDRQTYAVVRTNPQYSSLIGSGVIPQHNISGHIPYQLCTESQFGIPSSVVTDDGDASSNRQYDHDVRQTEQPSIDCTFENTVPSFSNTRNCTHLRAKHDLTEVVVHTVPHVSQQFDNFGQLIELSSEQVAKYSPENLPAKVIVKVNGGTCMEDHIGIDSLAQIEHRMLKYDILHTDETLGIGLVEETATEVIEAKERLHSCTEKYSLFCFTCGLCKAEFHTICKLHDHFENHHSKGNYIYYHSTRTGFPRFRSECKDTQTDWADLMDSNREQVKDGEVNETESADEMFEKNCIKPADCTVVRQGEALMKSNQEQLGDYNINGNETIDELTDKTAVKPENYLFVRNGDAEKKTNENTKVNKRKAKKERKKKKAIYELEEKEVASVIQMENTCTRPNIYLQKIKKSQTNKKKKKMKIQKMNSSKMKSKMAVEKSTAGNQTDDDSGEPKTGNQTDDASGESKTGNQVQEDMERGSTADFVVENIVHKRTKSAEKVTQTKLDSNNDNFGIYNCCACATKYSTKDKLRYHMSKVHRKANTDEEKRCRWCGQSVQGSRSYIAHMRQCEKNENLVCLICDRKFATKLEVTDHLVTHRNIKEMKCKLCEKHFTSEVSLLVHLRRHNKPKNIQCEHCGKAFYYQNLLKKHMLYCNQEPSINCTHCPLKFKTPDALKHHMSVHSSERPFVCHICGYAGSFSFFFYSSLF